MKKIFFRALCLMLCLLMVVSFAACGAEDTTSEGNNTTNTPDEIPDDNTGEKPGENPSEKPGENSGEKPGENPGEEVEPPIDAREELTVREMLETLASSPFQNFIKPDKSVVIDDVSKVGVDKEKFDNELLYPYPDDSEFDHIYNVTDYGIVKDGDILDIEITRGNSVNLNKLFSDLKEVEGKKKIVFPQGNYYFASTWLISDLDDIYICSDEYGKFFNIVFTNWVHAIQIEGGSNVRFRDYTLTYDPSSAVGGEIVRYNLADRTITVKIYEEFDMTRRQYNGGIFPTTHSYVEFVWDDVTKSYIPDPNGNLLYDHMVSSLSYDNDSRELVLKVTNATMIEPTVGKRVNVAYTEHQYFGFSASNCKSIYLEHINIYTTCGMGFGFGSIDDVYMNQVKIDLDPNSTRLMTCTADALHSTDTLRMTITNCAFKYSHDDALNVKSWYKNVDGIQSNIITVSGGVIYPFEVGDEVEIFDESTFEFIGAYTVKNVISGEGASYRLRLDRKIGDGKEMNGKYLLANTSRGTRLTFKNNIVGNKRNRGIMVQCRDSVIENNTFMNIVHGTLCIYTIRDSASEGICPKNITIANNKFIHNRDHDVVFYTWGSYGQSVGVMRNIYIYNNFMTNAVNCSIHMRGAGDSEIHNNIFYDVALNVDPRAEDHAAIVLQTGKNISVYDNASYQTVQTKNFYTLNASSTIDMPKKSNNKAYQGDDF